MAVKKHRHQHTNQKFKGNTMINKIIALSLFVSLSSLSFATTVEKTDDKPKTKVVCKDVTKDGKTTKQCKTIKVHKKLEGTKVPPEKKK